MTPGMLLLMLLAVGVFCGLLQRVLDRMYLTDRQALAIIAAMLVGTFIPNIHLGSIMLNVGGIIPAIVCIELLFKADTSFERLRAMIGSLITAALIFAISTFLPSEAEQLSLDPLWIYGVTGGLIAWIIGHSRRCAFICGTLGVLLADILSWSYTSLQGYTAQLVICGGGIADAVVISGVFAVLFCEILGEMVERIVRTKKATEQKT